MRKLPSASVDAWARTPAAESITSTVAMPSGVLPAEFTTRPRISPLPCAAATDWVASINNIACARRRDLDAIIASYKVSLCPLRLPYTARCETRSSSSAASHGMKIPRGALLATGLLASCTQVGSESPTPGAWTDAPALHVQGTQLVDTAGRVVRLRGGNRSGAEYACAQGWGFFDGPSDSASVQAIKSWNANAVRVPLNETCWLAINGVAPAYSGDNYRRAISDYVALLNRAGLVVILDLHWSAAGTAIALGQAPMPNRDHTPQFWSEFAAAYGSNSRVIFALFNEPFPDNNADTPEAWRCWRDGGTCTGMSYQAAGMQELVNAVRRAGAKNVIMLGGVQYSAGLSG